MRERTHPRRSGHGTSGGGAAGAPTPLPLPPQLLSDVERAGFYPSLVVDGLQTALGGEEVDAHLVHQETTIEDSEVRRHVTVLAATATRLLVTHADDHGADETSPEPYAVCSTESVPLERVSSVVVSQVVTRPADHRPGAVPAEVSLTVGWGAVQRVDLEPAGCPDPDCEADHGYTGTLSGDDLTVRVAGAAEGADAVAAAVDFARSLSAATCR
ncbi:DUF5998 family protein [Kineococcus gypseus]|uniref:DUF5998 family protein n=1 Tax=Kineococcus gypseus TaxID=1637102 RepID=UPI003D7DC0A0